jgi:hypothetical protein
MRCTQFVGLTGEARDFLDGNVNMVDSRPCPHCGKMTETEMEKIDEGRFTVGMFDEEIPLSTYRLKDGRIAREVVQADPWSSGPVIFTCLEVEGLRIGEWPQEAIDNA